MTLHIGILTVSDRAAAGAIDDRGGSAVESALAGIDAVITERAVVPDERAEIAHVLQLWADERRVDVIFTTGGTGLGPRDVTPHATHDVCDYEVPGIAEAIRAAGVRQTENAMLSRAIAGTRGATLIVNVPGSPRGAANAVATVAPVLGHAVAIMHGGAH